MGGREHPRELVAAVWSAFRRRCHQFIAIGYTAALVRIRSEGHEETDITGYICEALENWFRQHPSECFAFYVKEDPPVASKKRSGKRRRRTDIVIGYAVDRRPEFVFECKRLHHRNAGLTRYIGAEGLGCFIESRYAKEYREAGMIGYVQSHTPQKWQQELKEKVRQGHLQFRLERLEESVQFSDSFSLEWASTHKRYGLESIRVLHILLDCSKSQRAAARRN